MTKEIQNADYLNQCLTYDPETGLLYWKERPREHFKTERAFNTWNSRFKNQLAFPSVNKNGYSVGTIDSKRFYAHRVIYSMMKGFVPNFIDHIDGNKLNNRIENLRGVTKKENSRNSKKKKNNSSGVNGVYWDNSRNKWCAAIWDNGINRHIGYFDSLSVAASARKVKETELGYYENHGTR